MTGSTDCRRCPRSRRRDLVETAVAYGLILLVVWTPRPWQRILWLVAAAAIIFFTCISLDTLQSMGLRRANFLRSLWVAGVALAVSGLAIALAAHLHTLRLRGGPLWIVRHYWAYALWAAVQQFLLQCFFLARLRRVLPSAGAAVLAAAGIFALAHLPNPILTSITFVWGLVACVHFLRYRNLYPLILAHAIFGITVSLAIPGPVVHNMRVGLGYLTYTSTQHSSYSAQPQ